ncbi:MAG: DegT/DnrJ/EryC1/StrS aminotransferase family protein [bacterium]
MSTRESTLLWPAWPSYTEEQIAAVSKVLQSGQVNYWTGEECRLFEKEFAEFSGTAHAVALSNGSVAIELALKSLGIGPGDEVIVTPRSYFATVSSIVLVGAAPIFVDVDQFTQNITAQSISQRISSRTKAVICVHLAGAPCDMDPILELTRKHGIRVIEDCAQAHGASYKGKMVGSIGDVGTWSFCQDKIMTTGGEGGMVTTNDPDLWKAMWSHKDHGKNWETVYHGNHGPGFRWLHESFGTNWRMTEIQGVMGRIQLKKMEAWTQQRLSNAQCIWKAADELPGLRSPKIVEGGGHAAYKAYVFVVNTLLKDEWTRDRIMMEIQEAGVPCLTGSCPEIYLEKAFEGTTWRPETRLPVARQLGETSLMFQVHPTLLEKHIDKVTDVLTEIMKRAVR